MKQGNPPPDHVNGANDDENTHIQRKLASLTTWLVIVGFLQAFILAVTVVALLLQTSVARNTERAWISVAPVTSAPGLAFTPEPGNPTGAGALQTNIFVCSLKNTGETPARLVDSTVSYRTVSRLEDIPTEPQYEIKGAMNDFLLVKNDSVAAYAYLQPQIILTQAQAQAIFNRQAFLYAYGVVTHRDVFDKLHETRFGYVYFFPQGGDPRPAGFQRAIEKRPAYNRAT